MARLRAHAVALLAVWLIIPATPARADVTAFIGSMVTPWSARTTGVAVGMTVIVVGVEFEYAASPEDASTLTPGLTTGSLNVLVQAPFAVKRVVVYGTAGAGLYRQQLGAAEKTGTEINVGGGVKIGLAGPLRLRLDYRILTLRDAPVVGRPQRFYAGLNLAF